MKKLILFAGTLAALTAPAAARATMVEALPAERFPSYIQVTGTDKSDRVTITLRASKIFLRGPNMSSGSGCQMSTEREAVCPGVDSLTVATGGGRDRVIVEDSVQLANNGANNYFNLGRGDDTVQSGIGPDTVEGDVGDDRLIGGSGIDSLYGGPGVDVLNAKDGLKDRVLSGGPGRDRCHVDSIDPRAASCTTR